MTVKELVKKEPESTVARAYRFAENAHKGQKRKTGEPYFNHVLATAQTLYEWKLDESSVAAGLLHDTVEDTAVTLDDVRREFGDEIAFLVDGVTKLGRIKYRGAEARVENLRKMFLALSEDLRVVFVKLADRLHNMKTLGALPPQKQKRIAMETDDVYAPIAYRLGMQNLSGELHDIAFPYLHPQEDRWLKNAVHEKYAARHKYLEKIKPVLEKTLAAQGLVPLAIDFRAKRMSSLYQKLLRHDMDIEQIYDLVAMRIIVDNVAECYNALGVIHQLWPPAPGRIKDYIALPKPNGYRSLHTTVIGPDQKFVEIQIRTRQMHDENENGIAAHWLYEQDRQKPGNPGVSSRRLAAELEWVQQLRRWQEKFDNANSEEFLRSMKIDFFKDRIFAITPDGDVIDLPKGATPVDFAYMIHSEIGNTCIGAKVNGSLVPLNHELQSGDIVLIMTQKGKKPSEEWLEFAKTGGAREHIRAAMRKGNNLLKSTKIPTRTELKIVVEDRVGLLKDITAALARSHVNILAFAAHDAKGGKFPTDKIEVATVDRQKVEKLILKLKSIKGVREVSYQLL
jgi:GTP diphosphokinase / guanosine-3',5'-bis(diphosphate) 3'-diphosphatase